MEANLADLFELAVDVFGDREYIVTQRGRRSYAEMDRRSNQLAHYLSSQGIGAGDHIGIYAYNSIEWVETMWAVLKLRAAWININYRYVAGELRHIVASAQMSGLVFADTFEPRVAELADVLGEIPMLRVSDGSDLSERSTAAVDYEAALAGQSEERDFAARSGDDHYILFTGGTTGLPKGVVWRHEDVFFALGGGLDPMTNIKVEDPADLIYAQEKQDQVTFFPLAPLMHGASQWGVIGQAFKGHKVLLHERFDADEIWALLERESANILFITGDAMGRPLIECLDHPARPYDTSSLIAVSSTAALFSPSVKEAFFRHFPNLIITDSIGSSETGAQGVSYAFAGEGKGGGPTVSTLTGTIVVDDDFQPIPPGSGIIGRVARSGHIPIGYHNDPVKTAESFKVIDGVRYAIPGDYALVEEDGTITLLGRGSVSINSGGEKIFPEEIETALKSHPSVWDATVVGVPDERWGERVAAVIAFRAGLSADLKSLHDHLRQHVAGYKLPRQLHVVDEIVRSPSGKPDYTWAKTIATTVEPDEMSLPATKS